MSQVYYSSLTNLEEIESEFRTNYKRLLRNLLEKYKSEFYFDYYNLNLTTHFDKEHKDVWVDCKVMFATPTGFNIEDVKNTIATGIKKCFGNRINVNINLEVIDYSPSNIVKEDLSTYLCIPQVKEIIHNKKSRNVKDTNGILVREQEVFIVQWEDGTKTKVALKDGDTSDELVAFMYCMAKKMFGNKYAARAYVKEKKEAFKHRLQISKEMKKERSKRIADNKNAKKECPFANGLIEPAPQLSLDGISTLFKRKIGRRC